MPKPAHTPITTAADLRAALAGVPDERRVVVVDREGRVMACELMMATCGDWVTVMVCEMGLSDEVGLPT